MNELQKNFDLFFAEATGKRIQAIIGRKVVEVIYRRVKSGYGVNSDSLDAGATKLVRLKPLSTAYINFRKGVIIYVNEDGKTSRRTFNAPRLGEFGGPGKSNLTFSGKMLKALTYQATGSYVRVFILDSQRDDGQSNAEVAEKVSREGRPFLALSDDELRIIASTYEREIRALIKKYF